MDAILGGREMFVFFFLFLYFFLRYLLLLLLLCLLLFFSEIVGRFSTMFTSPFTLSPCAYISDIFSFRPTPDVRME